MVLPSFLFSSIFSTKILYEPVFPMQATCHAHLVLFYFITGIIFGEQEVSLNSSVWRLFHLSVTSFLLGANIFFSTLFLNTLNLRSFLNMNDQVSHPYKTTGKILVLCILVFLLLVMKLEEKRFCTEWWQAYSLTSISSSFLPEWNFDSLRLFPNIWTPPHFK